MSILPFEPDGLFNVLNWTPFIKMQDWMEENMIILDGGDQGAFSTWRMPHMERIFQEIDKLTTIQITLMSASQVGKTLMLVSALLKRLDTDPDNTILMFPKGNQLKRLYDTKVKIYVNGCDTINSKLENYEDEAKNNHQSSYSKKIAGAVWSIVDTNNVKSTSAKTLGCDEVADFPVSKAGQAMERLKSYEGKGELAFFTSTQHPERGGDDEINQLYNISEVKMQYWAYCEKCQEHYYPEPETLVYPSVEEWKEDIGLEQEHIPDVVLLAKYAPYVRKNAKLQCPHCGNKIDNTERKRIILDKKFEWIEVEPNIIDENGIVTSWKKVEKPLEDYTSIAFDINTLCIQGFDMGKIAEKIVQNTYGKNKIADLQATWVGYFNRIYKTSIKKREANDILLLTNGLPRGIVPENTAKLYFIADTQKDHWWWMVCAVQWGKIFNVVEHGKVMGWETLKELAFRSWKTVDGEYRYADRATVDMRGYQRLEEKDADGEIIQLSINTTVTIKELIVKANIEARKNGFAKRDEHFFIGTMGQEKLRITDKELELATKRGENPTGDICLLKNIEDKQNPELTYKVLHISNLAAKTELFQAINDNIENFKQIEEGKNPTSVKSLYYINDDMAKEGLNRSNPRETDFEKMLTSEVFDYEVKNGKTKGYKTFIQIRKRNDQLDNSATAIALASLDNIGIGYEKAPLFNPFD